MKYTVEEVRAHAAILRDWRNGFDPGVGNDDAAGMLDAHADLLERIKADESAVPVAQLRLRLDRWDVVGIHGEIEKLHLPTGEYPLFTHPPVQVAQAGAQDATEVHASLEAWRQAHKKLNDSMDSIRRFSAAPSIPTESAKTADSVRVPDGMVEAGCVAWNKSAGLGYAVADRDCMRAAIEAALSAQGQGNPVAWLVVDAKGKRFTIYNRELAEAIKQSAEQLGSTITVKGVCEIPPQGWYCTRQPGHEGPCAAWENTPPTPPASPAGVPDVVSEVMAELEKAIRKFPTWPTDPLHAVGVFNEEAGELSKAVLQQVYEPHKNAPDDVRKEARQAAAMALRFLVSIDSYDWTPGTQHEQPSLAATPITIIQDGEVSAADFAAAMRSCGLSLKTFAEVDREARRVAKERAAAPSAPEGDGGEG